jgi:hypothetical protein
VLGGKVEEGNECLGVIDDLRHGLRPLRPVIALEADDRSDSVVTVLGVADLRDGPPGGRVGGVGQSMRTLFALCTQQRWVRVSGNTSARAAQNPNAPSPTAIIGADMPRRRRSRSTSAQLSVDSRIPSEIDTSSLVPSARTPTMTSAQRRCSSRRMLKCTPSAHT